MDRIDKNFYSFFAVLGCFGVAYLLGAFVGASMDIKEWDPVGRFFTVAFGVAGAIASVVAIQSED